MKTKPESWDTTELDGFVEAALTRAGSELPSYSDVLVTIEKTVMETNRWLGLVFHEGQAEVAFGKLVEEYRSRSIPFSDSVINGEADTFEILSKNSRLYSYFETLSRYAKDGSPDHRSLSSLEEQIEFALTGCALTLPRVPREWFSTDSEQSLLDGLWIVFGKARARRRLDRGDTLILADVALLSGITLKSASNATQKRHGEKRLVVGRDSRIENENALIWLLGRKGFTPSPNMNTNIDGEKLKPSRPEDFVFIPVDAYGNAFLPDCSVQTGPGVLGYHVMLDGKKEDSWGYFETIDAMTVADDFAWIANAGNEWVSPAGWTKTERHRLRRMVFELEERARSHWQELAIELEKLENV